MKKMLQQFLVLSIPFILFSCDDSDYPSLTKVKEWNLTLNAKNEIPAPASSAATGTAKLVLYKDNSLKYEFNVTGLASGDALTMSHLHVGNAGSNGPVILPLAMSFTSAGASGTVTNLRQSLVDSLKSDANDIYMNVHSQQAAAGIVRAQLNTTVEFAMDVALSSQNEVNPPVPIIPTATGKSILRLTADKKLYSTITVTGLGPTDQLSAAHIHSGAAGTNGAVLIPLASSAAQFGVLQVISLADPEYTKLKADALYVNAHSANYPQGVARGQIR